MTKKIIGFWCVFLLCIFTYAQEGRGHLEKGDLTLGMRTTSSLFGHDNIPGLGTGGQFRLQLLDYLSTEWFADWITMNLNDAGVRKNAHIGWSVLFYPKKFNKFTSYLLAGHCFDYAEVVPLSTPFLDRSDEQVNRWSSAVQAGAGFHYFLSDHFNVSFSAQYMLHLGEHLDYELENTGSGYFLETNTGGTHGTGTETHLLLTLSLNYRIARLWD